MTNVYQIKLKNKELNGFSFLFDTKEGAEAVINSLNLMTVKGKKLKWECTILPVYSKEDAFNDMASVLFPNKNN